jgi:hypothetical protein
MCPIVTLPGGDVRDEIRQPLYDTIIYVAAETLAGTSTFFTSVVNPVTGSPKSLMMTNLTQAGQLPTATSFRIQGLCIDAQNQNAANVNILSVIMEKSSLSLSVGVKNYWQGPLRFACGRQWESGFTGTAAALAVGRTYQEYGWQAIQPVVLQGKHVVDLNPLQNFSLTLDTEADDLTAAEAALVIAAATQILVVGSLKGLLRRPVQ